MSEAGSNGQSVGATVGARAVRQVAGGPELFSVVYGSDAIPSFTSVDLAELLVQCRARNRVAGVTGMLLHEHGKFLQALEGPRDVVRDLVARIERDPRHHDVRVLAEERIEQRRFPDWSMGSGGIDDVQARPLAAYSDALAATRHEQPDPPSRGRRLVDWFRSSR